jgi:Protein of unknown function, DUF481
MLPKCMFTSVRKWIFVACVLSLTSSVLGQSQQGLEPSSFPAETLPLTNPPPPLAKPFDPSQPLKMDVPETDIEPADGVHWYYPWTWFPLDGWTNSVELGINGSEGNSQSYSFQTGARFKRKVETSLFELRMTHNRTQSLGLLTQNNSLIFADYERPFSSSPWSIFTKSGLEFDSFKAFDYRFNLNSGLSYRWRDTKDLRLVSRFGSGTSREFGGPNNDWIPEAVFGGDYEHQVNERHKLILKVDYFPNWTDFADFRVVSDFAWEYLLSQERNLSLKLGGTDRYDSTPNGLKPNDINYNLLLLYKF